MCAMVHFILGRENSIFEKSKLVNFDMFDMWYLFSRAERDFESGTYFLRAWKLRSVFPCLVGAL